MVIPGPAPTTPAEIAAAQARRMEGARAVFFEAMIPLLVTPQGPWGLQVASAGTIEVDKVPHDALDIKPVGARMFRLLLEPKTHLPVRLTWMAKPVVTGSTTSTMTVTTQTIVRGGGPPQIVAPPTISGPVGLPPGDPTAGLSDVQWEMVISDHKVADGLNWPRRLRVSYGGTKYQDFRISRYRLNPKIDPKIFDRKK
jgi:hypothetical protein